MNILEKVAECNVTYHVLGETDRSAMPIGNGDVGASVWVNNKGTLCFYIAKSDALTEFDRNVKVGMVEVELTPNPFTQGQYKQTLEIANGIIVIEGQNANIQLFIDKQGTIYVTGEFNVPTSVKVTYRHWRNEANTRFYHRSEYSEVDIYETPDIVKEDGTGVMFYHKNGNHIIAETAKVQEVDEILDLIPDYLTHRIFGGYMVLHEGRNEKFDILHKDASNHMDLRIAIASLQGSEEDFQRVVKEQMHQSLPVNEARCSVVTWWNEYWKESYIFVEQDESVKAKVLPAMEAIEKEPMEYECSCSSAVTKAYTWTKYMTACCETGKLPIYYNGMLFSLCPGGGKHLGIDSFGKGFSSKPEEYSLEINPDERSWTIETLWQNVRHPYHSMLARGETIPMTVLFSYYRRFWELKRYQAKKYYNAKGQHNTEMTYTCGLQSIGIYGADRTGKPRGYANNRWGGAVDISPGLELLSLMLDYYDYTKEEVFLKEEIIPYAWDLLEYVATRFPNREHGKLVVGPLQSVETYWDTIDPIPTIAGLHSVVTRLLQLPNDLVANYEKLLDYQKSIPDLPTDKEDGKTILQPARAFDGVRHNVEIPELYTIFPFALYGVDKPELELARHTFQVRAEQYHCMRCFEIGETPGAPSYSGWQYQGVVAAMLGMTKEAKDILLHNCTLTNPGTRFPAMWGPIYDAVPDTDHGANILNLLQKMVMQVSGDKIYILPAFPQEWNVTMKLHVDKDTTIVCEYKDGKIEKLEVLPESRRNDVVIFK